MALVHPKTIEYKHDIGDKVFFMNNNKVIEGEVNSISVYISKDRGTTVIKIDYSIRYRTSDRGTSNAVLAGHLVFESKSKLLDSL